MRRFTVQTPDGRRELFFEASSESERQLWVEDLQRAGTIATQAATDRRVKATGASAGVDTEVRMDVAKNRRSRMRSGGEGHRSNVPSLYWIGPYT